MKQPLAGAVVLVSLVTTACAGPGATRRAPASDEAPASTALTVRSPAEALESLRAAEAARADAMVRKGLAEGLAASAAAEALLLLQGRYALRGPEAIRTGLAAEPMAQEAVQSAEALVWNVSADGRLGYTLGHLRLAPKPGAPAPAKSGEDYLRYLAVWTRTPDGPWQLAAVTHGRSKGPLQVPPSFSVVPASAPPATPMAPTDVLAEAFAADSAFSAQSTREGMGIAFGAWAAPDAVLPNGPSGFFGHDAIASGYAPFTRDQVDLRWEPRLGAAASSGDLAYTVGRAVSVATGPDGTPDTRYLKYLSVWRRQPDGAWRYVADGGNGSPGPDGP